MSYPTPQGGYPPLEGAQSGQRQSQGYPSQPQGYPPQQFYQQPFPAYPLQQQTYGGVIPPHPQHYGAPAPSQAGAHSSVPYGTQYEDPHYGIALPTPPSPGYGHDFIPQDQSLLNSSADALRKAMKGLGTDEALLISTLAHFPAPLILHLKAVYQQRHHRSLESDIASETSNHFEAALLAVLRGPLQQDVFLLNRALKGIGTNEPLLNDVVIARSNADLNAIKAAYNQTYHRTLQSDVSSDLSGKTERLFSMILSATRQEETAPVLPHNVDADVMEFHRATEAKHGTDELNVCSLLSSRSDGQIRALALAYEAKYRLSLEKVIAKEFSGHMKTALIQMVRAACDRAMRDAVLLEDSMAGLGTKDDMLISRLVSMHWNRDHMGQIKGAYKVRYGKDLITRINGETSGDYKKLMVAMVE